jgi:hypothetical protein
VHYSPIIIYEIKNSKDGENSDSEDGQCDVNQIALEDVEVPRRRAKVVSALVANNVFDPVNGPVQRSFLLFTH